MTVYGSIGELASYHVVTDNRIRNVPIISAKDTAIVFQLMGIRSVLGFDSPIDPMLWTVVNEPTPVVFLDKGPRSAAHSLAPWLFDYAAQVTLSTNLLYRKHLPDVSGHISGIVKVEGVLWEGIIVRLYYKRTGAVIKETRTASDGSFRFDYLPVNEEEYVVMAHKDGFNAVVFDGVKPVDESGSSLAKPPLYYDTVKLEVLSQIASTNGIQGSSYFSTSYYPHFVHNKSSVGPAISNSWLSADQTANQKLQFNPWTGGYYQTFDTIFLENYHDSGGNTDRGIYDFEVWGIPSNVYINADPNYVTGYTLLGTFRAREHIPVDTVDPQFFKLSAPVGPYPSVAIRMINRLPTSTSNYLGIRSFSFMRSFKESPINL